MMQVGLYAMSIGVILSRLMSDAFHDEIGLGAAGGRVALSTATAFQELPALADYPLSKTNFKRPPSDTPEYDTWFVEWASSFRLNADFDVSNEFRREIQRGQALKVAAAKEREREQEF